MTAKEKAIELITKYQYAVRFDESEIGYFANMHSVKECALIAVDEILEQFNQIKVSHIITGYITYKDFEENLTNIQDQLDSKMISKWNYWNEVKQEINRYEV